MAETAASPAPPPRRRNPWPRRIAGGIALLLGLLAGALVLLDSAIGHRWVVDRIAAMEPANGLRYRIGRIEGSLFSEARLVDVRIADQRGEFFRAPEATLDWRPFAWLGNRLDIERLDVPRATLARLPELVPTGRTGPILPGFDIRIGQLSVDRLDLGAELAGTARTGRLAGSADIRGGRALIDLSALVEGSDRLRARIDVAPDDRRFDMDVAAQGAADGVLARMTGIARPIALRIDGQGDWERWTGTAIGNAGDARVVDLKIGNMRGQYSLGGFVAPAALTQGKIARLTAPRVAITGAATLENRLLDGRLGLRSPSLSIEAEGGVDLARSAFRSLRISARLAQPQALFPNMTGRNIDLRVLLNGSFDTARFDYRITADRIAFDNTGFDVVRAAGRGRLSDPPVRVPMRLTAARVTGVGDVAGGILRNLAVDGTLLVTSRMLNGDGLRLTSDRLNARIDVMLDLVTGNYQVGLSGGLRRYLIPGLGIVDVQSRLRVVPGPGGRGTRVIGTGAAQMVRLDNAFFASLAGGLPRITTGLERGPDGVLVLRGLVLTAPDITIRGNGYRRTDGTFRFEGRGVQRTYGPFSIGLDGDISRPSLNLRFDSPNETLGLTDVAAELRPNAGGYAFQARGGSRLGPFDGEGQILLPSGGTARIEIARLDVSGTRASGALDIVEGGFAGAIAFAGGGLDGRLDFRPQGGIQRIDGNIEARRARLGPYATVQRGRTRFSMLLDPAGTTIEGDAQAFGLRRGALTIGRLNVKAQITGGNGRAQVTVAGSRGRAFDIASDIAFSPTRIEASLKGTLDRQPITLARPAVLTAEGDGWRLAPAQLQFAGGQARVAGLFGSGGSTIQATLARMPMTVLDIGYPGLGLAGSASGTLTYADTGDGRPTGRMDMTVRGLSRSGLVLSSRPVDIGIAGVLNRDSAGARAVIATGGKTVGRAQMQLRPLGEGGLAALAAAPLFAQLRYEGPGDALWRLTGIEIFDLSGPVAVGADVTGRLADPRIRGVVRANGARIESAVTGTQLSNVQASGRFDGSRLAIDRFTASDGRSGSVTGSGLFDLAAVRGFGMDLNVEARNAVLIDRDDIGATVTGPLRFRSDGSGGLISGEVVLNASRYRLGRAVVAAPVPRLNIREINRAGEEIEDSAPALPWRMAIRARAPGNMIVTGLGLDSEWSANLEIGGEPTNPVIKGTADLVQGDYEFAGRDFELERGAIRFDGSVPANPSLDIAARADEQGISATIRVTGNAERPQIGFSSIPALPEDELLSRLLFGTSITNLSAPEALQLAAAVAALQDGSGDLNPLNALRRSVGLDRLRIVPADPQTGQGTSVAAGKFLTRRAYVEIITDGQGYSATRLEFRVTRWLSLLATISTVGRQSTNVRVSRDY